jgi:glycosyltransferase involved in cell wall biosynthesis
MIDLANAQSMTHEVDLLIINDDVSADSERRVLPGVSGTKYGRVKGTSKIRSVLAMRSLIKGMCVDVVHCHSETLAPFVWRLPCIVVLTVHNAFGTSRFWGPAFDIVVAISENVKRTVRYCGHRSITGIHNGFDETLFPADPECSRFRVTPSLVRFVLIGRLDVSVKRQDEVLEAFVAVRKYRPDLSLSIDLIGDGPSRTHLETIVRESNLAGVVAFVGQIPRSEVIARLGCYDYIVHGAPSEGFGLVIAEAMAAGVIPIVRSKTGAEEVLGAERCGYMFDDPVTLRDCLLHVIEESGRSEYVRLRSQAAAHARATFGISSCASKYDDVYRSIQGQ